MGVWLQSRSVVFALRDGTQESDPLLAVMPTEPTWFANLYPERFEFDKDVFAVKGKPAPAKDYAPPLYREWRERRRKARSEVETVSNRPVEKPSQPETEEKAEDVPVAVAEKKSFSKKGHG